MINNDNKKLNNMIWNSFTTFFREEKCYIDWNDDEIGGSMNNDDIDEFIEYTKKALNYEIKEVDNNDK